MTENTNKAGYTRGSAMIHTTSAEIGTALNLLEDAREQIQAGEPLTTIDAQLYLVHERLSAIILRTLDAKAEFDRRKDEYERTGTITFPEPTARLKHVTAGQSKVSDLHKKAFAAYRQEHDNCWDGEVLTAANVNTAVDWWNARESQ
jgi:hypothetical protein